MSDLHDPDIRPLWLAIRDRLIKDGDVALIRTVRLQLSPVGLARINGWLSRTPSRASRLIPRNGWVSVPVDRLLAALGVPATDLLRILNDTVGIPEQLQPHRRLAAMKSDFWSYATAALPNAPRLVQHLRLGGLTETGVGDRRRLIDALGSAHQLIPLHRPVPLPRLAEHCAGDPHYFDLNPPGRGNKLVLLVAELLGESASTLTSPAHRFALLTRAGIYPDRLSAAVIALNLDATGTGQVDEEIRAARSIHRPVHLTLYDLTMHCPHIAASEPVTVVENPSVIEEAIIRGYQRPLACTSGALSAVDHIFLQQLADCGVPIRYSGDDDQAGREIAEVVRSRFGAEIIGPGPSITGWRHAELGEHTAPIYQEAAAYLELLLGPDVTDPLKGGSGREHAGTGQATI